jgi:predicted MFS family arabinose efflux permease
MLGGGALCAATFAGLAFDPAWQVQFALYVLMGIGFYTLHGCIQVEASELSPTARGTALSMHSLMFFLGHATGPVLYSVGFAHFGASTSVLLGGVVVMLTAMMCARYLRRRSGPRSLGLP